MGSHKQLIEHLLAEYQGLNFDAMAACYHENATFTDIAFRLKTRKKIHAMWHMICANGMNVQIENVESVGDVVRARIIDTYKLSDTKNTVVNKIDSTFHFQGDLIIAHCDDCDAIEWARQAFGGLKGAIVGRIGLLRRIAARKKIDNFIASHPKYA